MRELVVKSRVKQIFVAEEAEGLVGGAHASRSEADPAATDHAPSPETLPPEAERAQGKLCSLFFANRAF